MTRCAVKSGSKREFRGTKFQGLSDALLGIPLSCLVTYTYPRVPGEGGLDHRLKGQRVQLSPVPGGLVLGLLMRSQGSSLGLPLCQATLISRITLYILFGLWGMEKFQQGLGGPFWHFRKIVGFFSNVEGPVCRRDLSGSPILCSSTMNSGCPTCYGSVFDVTPSCNSF